MAPHSSPSSDPALDDLEWDSPHCCSCCCACCACHKISHAFWWVLLLTLVVLGVGVGVLVDGFMRQADCRSNDDFSTDQRQKMYDDCRQQAYIQILAAAGLGGLFILLLFVTCCAFMDVLCFRRFRSRPHMRPKPRVRTPAPRAQYDSTATANGGAERYGANQQNGVGGGGDQWQPVVAYQMQPMRPSQSLQPPAQSFAALPVVQQQPQQQQLAPPRYAGNLAVAPALSPQQPGAASLSPMPTLGERMRMSTPTQPVRTLGGKSAEVAASASAGAASAQPAQAIAPAQLGAPLIVVPPPVPPRRPSVVTFAPSVTGGMGAASSSAYNGAAQQQYQQQQYQQHDDERKERTQSEWNSGGEGHYGPGSTDPSAPPSDPYPLSHSHSHSLDALHSALAQPAAAVPSSSAQRPPLRYTYDVDDIVQPPGGAHA